jgi:DNA-binding PadR family transcriptional regulator
VRKRRISDTTAAVLKLFLRDPSAERFGRDIILETGIKSGSLYPILERQQNRGVLTSSWEDAEEAAREQRRPRRLYRLDDGREAERLYDQRATSRRATASSSRPELAK